MNEQAKIPDIYKEFSLYEHRLLDDSISIKIPSFITKDLNVQDPLGNQEIKYLKTSADEKIKFILGVSEQTKMGPEDVKKYTSSHLHTMQRMVPGFEYFGSGTKKINGNEVGCIEYKSNGLKDCFYNIYYLFSLNGNLTYGSFICPYEWNSGFQAIVQNCLETLKIKAV